MKIILASGSPRRKEILGLFKGLRYEVIRPNVDENIDEKNPRRMVEKLALKKALSVLSKIRRKKDAVILGADTVVFLKGKIIGKPISGEDAERTLQCLSGSRHKVYTGVALVDVKNLKILVSSEATIVKMRRLKKFEIKQAARKHKDKAGAYAVQERNDPFVEKIEGDYFNVVGLPVKLFRDMLKKLRPSAALRFDVKKFSSKV